MDKGSFNITDQQQIGKAENEPLSILFVATIEGVDFKFKKPIRYKYTDPVKGEIYQPVQLGYPVYINSAPSLLIFKNEDVNVKHDIHFSLQANKAINEAVKFTYNNNNKSVVVFDSVVHEHTRAKSSTTHYRYLLSILEKYLTEKQYLNKRTEATAALHQIADSIHRRSLVCIFSDMFEDNDDFEKMFAALQHLKYNKHEVVLFHVVDKSKE